MPKLKLVRKAKSKKPKQPRQSFKLVRKKDLPKRAKVTTVRALIREVARMLGSEWKFFVGIGLVYAAVHRLLAEGLGRLDLGSVQSALVSADPTSDKLWQTAVLAGTALTASGTGVSAEASVLSVALTMIFALSIVWGVRQFSAGQKIRIRDALYNGSGPIVPVLLLLLVISLQALPMAVGVFMYGSATSTGIVSSGAENMLLFVAAALLSLLTCYLLSASIIGLVAGTLPGMYPLAALRAGKKLVQYRRWQVFMKAAIFALIMAILWLIVIALTVSNFITIAITTEVIDLLRALTLVLTVVFLYKLYRSLVDEPAAE